MTPIWTCSRCGDGQPITGTRCPYCFAMPDPAPKTHPLTLTGPVLRWLAYGPGGLLPRQADGSELAETELRALFGDR